MGQSTSPPSKDRTCCCCCLWLPLPWRRPRPSGTPTWCRMCTTSTLSSMHSTESTVTPATPPTMLLDTLATRTRSSLTQPLLWLANWILPPLQRLLRSLHQSWGEQWRQHLHVHRWLQCGWGKWQDHCGRKIYRDHGHHLHRQNRRLRHCRTCLGNPHFSPLMQKCEQCDKMFHIANIVHTHTQW